MNHTSAKSAADGQKVVQEIHAAGSKAVVVQASVASLQDHKRIVEAALSLNEHGKIDILVHK